MFKLVAKFVKRKEGTASVEFAFTAPVMVLLFIGMVELGDAMIAKRKVTSMTSTVADLVARVKSISDNDISNVFSAAIAIVAPFPENSIQMRITSISIALNGSKTIAWSDGYNMSPLQQGGSAELPAGVGVNGGSVIKVETNYAYTSFFARFLPSSFTFTEEFFAQPRKILKISRV
ncbi:MAG: TadE/TadG family type IV pilus assembly protein [Hyphomicrobiales bacterium]